MTRRINRLVSFQYALAGIWYTFKTQRNAQIHLAIAAAIFLLGLVLNLGLVEWAILALTTGFVISTEMLNTVAEAAMDYATSDFNPQVKVVKDVAAGAVLVAAVTAVVVGFLILGPPLLQRLSFLPSIHPPNQPMCHPILSGQTCQNNLFPYNVAWASSSTGRATDS